MSNSQLGLAILVLAPYAVSVLTRSGGTSWPKHSAAGSERLIAGVKIS